MAEMSGLYGESANNTKIEEHLEESLISQDRDTCEKLKQKNQLSLYRQYRQTLDLIRINFRDIDEAYERMNLEKVYEIFESITMTAKSQQLIDEYTTEKGEYGSCIADLEADIEKNIRKLEELQIERKKYTEKIYLNDISMSSLKEIFPQIEENMNKLENLLCNLPRDLQKLHDRVATIIDINNELCANLHLTEEELARKEIELENAVETAEKLSTNLMALELPKVIPASDTCKGNSEFAEDQVRQRVLSDKMELFMNSHNHIKQMLNMKITVIKMLKAEKSAITKQCETDAIDTSLEKKDLVNEFEYYRRISKLANKLMFQTIKSQEEEAQFTDDFPYVLGYVRSFITAKEQEIEQLDKKIMNQNVQILMQEETNHSISKELHYWRSKAMSWEAENPATKAQLEKEQINDDANIYLEDIKNCKISDNENFERICDHSGLIPDKVPENNTHKGDSTEMRIKPIMRLKPIMDSTKQYSEIVCSTKDTEDSKDITDMET